MSKIVKGIVKDLKAVPDIIKSCFKEIDTKKALLLNMPYIFTGYVVNIVSRMYRTAPGKDISEKAIVLLDGLGTIFDNPFPSLNLIDISILVLVYQSIFSNNLHHLF